MTAAAEIDDDIPDIDVGGVTTWVPARMAMSIGVLGAFFGVLLGWVGYAGFVDVSTPPVVTQTVTTTCTPSATLAP